MTRSQLQPGPATDHYHSTLGVDETTPSGGVAVGNGIDEPVAVTQLVAREAVFDGDTAILGGSYRLAGPPDNGQDAAFLLDASDTLVSGSYTLTFRGETTDPIAWDATQQEIVDALAALSAIGPDNIELNSDWNPADTLNDTSQVGINFKGGLGRLVIDVASDFSWDASALLVEGGPINPDDFLIEPWLPGRLPDPLEPLIGSIYIDIDGPIVYTNLGTIARPNWKSGPRAENGSDWSELVVSPTTMTIQHGLHGTDSPSGTGLTTARQHQILGYGLAQVGLSQENNGEQASLSSHNAEGTGDYTQISANGNLEQVEMYVRAPGGGVLSRLVGSASELYASIVEGVGHNIDRVRFQLHGSQGDPEHDALWSLTTHDPDTGAVTSSFTGNQSGFLTQAVAATGRLEFQVQATAATAPEIIARAIDDAEYTELQMTKQAASVFYSNIAATIAGYVTVNAGGIQLTAVNGADNSQFAVGAEGIGVTGLPATDPFNEGQLFTDGIPTTGVPKPLMVSGG